MTDKAHQPWSVVLLFRRPRPGGYYSIERYFQEVLNSLAGQPDFVAVKSVAPAVSEGLVSRLSILLHTARLKAGVYHITGDIHFAALALPGRRTILTIHDCHFLQHPNPLARLLLWLFWLKLPVAKAGRITTVSEHTKSDIIRHTNCLPDKITVIPAVIPGHFKPSPKPFHVSKPRILHIGAGAQKNLARHMEALRGMDCLLHIVAPLGQADRQRLLDYNLEYECTPDLSDQEILRAYEQCDLLLFASTREGFGMPILEAQSVGRPVVTSNCSSMPEVAGDAACLVNPFDVASIRSGILQVIHDRAYREDLIRRGFDNIRRFQVETVAGQYCRIYREIAESN